MMCSIEELGSSKDYYPDAPDNGIYILSDNEEYKDAPVGSDAIALLGLRDANFEYEVTSNRVDCFGVLGIAREAAATFGKPFCPPVVTETGNDENVNWQIYEVLQAHFSYLPDLLRTQQIRELTGFSMTAIQRWVLEKRITAILGRKGWNITRDSLVTFLSSSYCLRGNRKPKKFQALLQKCTEQLKI